MKLTTFSVFIYFFTSTVIFYTFFIVIEIMKKKYRYNYTLNNHRNLEPEEILLGSPHMEDKLEQGIDGFGNKNTQNQFSLPLDLIIDGQIIYENLNAIKKDYDWLTQVLYKKGIKDIKDITYGILDTTGEFTFTLHKE